MITYPTQIDTSSTIIVAVNNQTHVTAEVYNTLRSAVIAIENELGINPSQEFETVRNRLDNIFVILGTATPDPIPNTPSKRDSSGNSNFNGIGLNPDGFIKFSISGIDITGITCDSSKNITIGTNAESILIKPAINKDINISSTGTGTISINAIDTTSKFSLFSNSTEILHAENGLLRALQYSSFNGISAGVGLFSASAADSVILATKNSTNNDMNLISVVGDEINSGSTLAAGYNFTTGSSSAHTFFVDVNSVLKVSNNGIQFPSDFNMAFFTQEMSSFGNRPIFALQAAGGNTSLGGQGSNLILASGDPGVSGSDLPGDIILELKNSGDISGIFQIQAGSFNELLTLQHDNTVPATSLNILQNLEMLGTGYITIKSLLDDLTIGCGNSKSIFLSYGAGLTTRIQIDSVGIGFFTAAPVARQNITGSRGGNIAVASLLTGLANLGLITDSTTA